MFQGQHNITLDAKGRIALPARARAVLENLGADHAGQFVVTRHLSKPCLLLFPLKHWQQLVEELNQLNNNNPTHEAVKHILLGHAADLDCDSAGRLLLPPVLRTPLNLGKDIMLVGMGNTFQIWDAEQWQAQVQRHFDTISSSGDLPPLSF